MLQTPTPFEQFPASPATAEGMRTLEAVYGAMNVRYLCNVVYATKDNLALKLQILLPHSNVEPDRVYPCIVFVQGSAWLKQDVYQNLPQLARFAQRGYAVTIVEYRPSTVAMFPAQVKDTKTAIRFLRAHADEYRIDAGRMAVWGDSSGGHTALLTGYTTDQPLLDDEPGSPIACAVNVVVDYYGPTYISKMNDSPSTMAHYTPDSPEGRLIGGVPVLEHPERVKPTLPMTYIQASKPLPPTLILHGDKDRLVPFTQSVYLYEALRAAKKEVDFYKLLGADHGGGAFWTDETLDIVEAYLEIHW